MKLYPFVTTTTNRHGRIVRYYKPKGQRGIRLRHEPGTPEYDVEYNAAASGQTAPRDPASAPVTRGGLVRRHAVAADNDTADDKSLRWLVDQYFAHADFRTKEPINRASREADLLRICALPHPDGGSPLGERRALSFRRKHIERIRDAFETTGVGNRMLVSLSVVFAFGVRADFMPGNPCTGVDRHPSRVNANGKAGFETLPLKDAAKFERRWPVGTKERLAYEIAVYTGLRRSDLRRVGPQFFDANGWVDMREHKGGASVFIRPKHRPKAKQKHFPVPAGLQAIIDATEGVGTESWIVNAWGNPFANGSFGQWFKKALKAAGINRNRVNFHGLRKRSLADLADASGDLVEVMQQGNWSGASGLKNAAIYLEGVDKRRASQRAAERITETRGGRGVGSVVVPFNRSGRNHA